MGLGDLARGESLEESEIDELSPRCAACGYLLVGLEKGNCPECGRPFDLARRSTYQRGEPYRFFTYWLPAFASLFVLWLGYALVLLANNSIGWSLTIGVPVTIGFVVAYGLRAGWLGGIWLGFVTLTCVILTLITQNVMGVFCGVILGVIGAIPYLLGALFGAMLRSQMKLVARFSQRKWLPLLFAVLMPAGVEFVERRWMPPPAIVAQATPVLLNASLAEAWHAQVGESAEDARSVLHAIRLTRPLEQIGGRAVGDVSAIRFSKGELAVRVRERDEPHRFAFDYVGQSHVEDRAIRLLDTTFDYAEVSPVQTRVTMTTRYEPLMTPRWAWRPFEWWAGQTTHEQVGRQMQRTIDQRRG